MVVIIRRAIFLISSQMLVNVIYQLLKGFERVLDCKIFDYNQQKENAWVNNTQIVYKGRQNDVQYYGKWTF